NNIQGSVITRVVVERDGSVSHIQVTQSVNPALDEEALRLVKAFPKFKPGLQMDKAVRAYYNTSIKFSLN
ncbi:MAG: energy transducer TonB, partial [Bacteroidota bacterium]|nr:energy transducer TonB [Bacteroidota bacterium]